jgi:hypothetical protein
MEIFVDGGLFELLIALSLGYLINVIYLRKYLLVLYSGVAVASPILQFFLPRNDLFYFLAAITILNSILLIVLLWRHKMQMPGKPLFNLGEFKRKFSFRKKQKSPSFKP